MKPHPSSRPLLAVAASAALAFATPSVVRAQQPSATPGSTESDVFDVIKKGADKLQKQARETKELTPKVKLLEERENDLHKKMAELEQKLAKQQETIDHLHKEMEKLETARPVSSPVAADPAKPVAPLPVTEPPIQPTPAAAPSPTAS